MRKAFRTTIDEDVLFELKKMALEKGCHVNDIIEKLVLDNLHEQYFTKDLKKFPEMNLAEKQSYLKRRVSKVIQDVMDECNLKIKPSNFTDIMARTISDLILSDDILFPKKK
jgi:hypothetical protein